MSESRKIIHIDMDCFYAAIEIRDRPELAGKPVAVGGHSQRGVLTTCNYEARLFGCHSAMPTFKALQRCPELLVVPTRFGVYRRESALIREIFYQFTDLVEPLSLDEAYLDVSHLRSSGAAVAGEIRYRIHQATQLTASAGIAPNKLLAKIASDWKKPDGQFEVTLDAIGGFIWELPVRKLWGVGKKTGDKMTRMGVVSCGDLQRFRPEELVHEFGKFGVELYQQCRGEDHREVKPHRVRKSLGNERTFGENLTTLDACQEKLGPLLDEQADDLRKHGTDRPVAKAYVKVKFHDFTKTSVECVVSGFDPGIYPALLARAWGRGGGKSVRLIGVGVRFAELPQETAGGQLEILF